MNTDHNLILALVCICGDLQDQIEAVSARITTLPAQPDLDGLADKVAERLAPAMVMQARATRRASHRRPK